MQFLLYHHYHGPRVDKIKFCCFALCHEGPLHVGPTCIDITASVHINICSFSTKIM